MSTVAREAIKTLYPYPGWIKKVEKMSDDQVTAIFLKLKARGKI